MNNSNYNSSAMEESKKRLISQLYNEECEKIYDHVLRVSDAFYADLESNIPMWTFSWHPWTKDSMTRTTFFLDWEMQATAYLELNSTEQ